MCHKLDYLITIQIFSMFSILRSIFSSYYQFHILRYFIKYVKISLKLYKFIPNNIPVIYSWKIQSAVEV